jgi:uncharacterized protein (DUF58 family)
MRHFVPFLLILLLIALLLRVPLFVTVVYFLVGIYVLSRLWVRHTVDHLGFDRTFLDRAFQGDVVEVTVRATNSSRLPVAWIELRDSAPVELRAAAPPARVIALGPREDDSFTYHLNANKRGHYGLGPLYINTGDLLGIEQRSLMWRRADALIVYPKVVSLDRLGLQSLAAQPALVATSPLIEDPARVVGIRDYQRGDSPRRMHWTATARLQRLVVRQYEPTISRETMLFLDLDGDNYRSPYVATELAITAAASLANHIVTREQLPVGLMAEARDPLAEDAVRRFLLLPRPGRGQLLSVLEVLARVQMARGADFADAIRRQSVRLPWGATIVVITGSERPALMETLLYLRRGGFAVTLILVQPDAPGGASASGPVPTYLVRWEQDLERLA